MKTLVFNVRKNATTYVYIWPPMQIAQSWKEWDTHQIEFIYEDWVIRAYEHIKSLALNYYYFIHSKIHDFYFVMDETSLNLTRV
jgi:hypothetical protein